MGWISKVCVWWGGSQRFICLPSLSTRKFRVTDHGAISYINYPHHTALPNAEDSAEPGAVFSSHGKAKVLNFPTDSLSSAEKFLSWYVRVLYHSKAYSFLYDLEIKETWYEHCMNDTESSAFGRAVWWGDNAHSYIQCNFQHVSNFPTHIGKKFDIEKILKIF